MNFIFRIYSSFLKKSLLSSRTWFKSSWHSHFNVNEKFFDLKQTCKWKHFSSYISIFVSMLHSLKNIHQHFSSFTSHYSLHFLRQCFILWKTFINTFHHTLQFLCQCFIFWKIFISFNNLIIWKIFIFFNNLMKKSW